MLGQYISKDTLPGDLLGNLEQVTLNAGSSFLAGAATSSFAKTGNIVSNTGVIINTVTDPNLYKKLTTDLIQHAVTVTTNELTSYMMDKTTELLDFGKITSVLTESITYWTKENLMTPGEILEIVKTKKVQEEQEKQAKEDQKRGINDIIKNLTKIAGDIKDYGDKTIGSLDSGLSTITAYLTMGPDWVVNKVNSYVALGIEKAESFIGTYTDIAIQARDSAIDTIGHGIGVGAAGIVNNIAISAAKKTKADSEGLIANVQTKATNAIVKAIMMIRQLTGIAIPPVIPPLPKLTSLF